MREFVIVNSFLLQLSSTSKSKRVVISNSMYITIKKFPKNTLSSSYLWGAFLSFSFFKIFFKVLM